MPTERASIESTLINFIVNDLSRDKGLQDLSPDDDLLESSLVDSLGIMRLVAHIEKQFGFSVPSEDVVIENFINVRAIVDYLLPKIDGNVS